MAPDKEAPQPDSDQLPPDQLPEGQSTQETPLEASHRCVTAFIDSVLSAGGTLSPETAARILADIETMQEIIIGRVQRPQLRPYMQQEPDYREASTIMEAGREREEEKIKKMEEKEKDVEHLLQTIIGNLPANNLPRNRQELDAEELRSQLKALAKKIISVRKPTSKDIARIMIGDPLVRNYYRILPDAITKVLTEELSEEESTEENPLRKAVARLKAELSLTEGGVSVGFRKLRTDFYDLRVVDPDKIWKEINIEEETDMLASCAQEANDICEELFGGKYAFPEAVKKENKVKILQYLARENPVDEESFEIFKGACTKLELIHLIYYVRQIKLPFLQCVAKRLQQRLDRIVDSEHYHGRAIMNPPTPTAKGEFRPLEENGNHCEIDRFEVDTDTKPIVSIIRKIILKSLQNPALINDIVRCRVVMPAFVSEDSEMLRKEIEKVIGIILTEFGTDYDKSRIRCTLETGGSNEYSRGKHKGVHLTLKMRFRIPENGIYPGGALKEGAVDIEIQILGHMSPDEEADDHREYFRGKTEDVMREIGVDISFKDFVLQLAQVVNSRYDFKEDYTPRHDAKIGNIPFVRGENLREKLLLAVILTKRDTANGELINIKTIQELLKDIDAKNSLLQALRRMKRQKPCEVMTRSGKGRDVTASIRGNAKEAEDIIKTEDLSKLETSYKTKKTKSGNWMISKARKRGKITQERNWHPYLGQLYMLREGPNGVIRFYTVNASYKYWPKKGGGKELIGAKEENPILTHIIKGEEGNEKCYRVHEGREVLLWERTNNISGERIVKKYDVSGNIMAEEKDNSRISRRNITPTSFTSVDKHTLLTRKAIREELEQNKRAKPKLKPGQTLVYF